MIHVVMVLYDNTEAPGIVILPPHFEHAVAIDVKLLGNP